MSKQLKKQSKRKKPPKKTRRDKALEAREDKAIRRAKALVDGKEVVFLTCPLCGKNRPLQNKKGEKARFQIKPDYALITTRKGGGRRIGFFRLPDKDVNLTELKELYPDVFWNLYDNVKELFDILETLKGVA